jgi:hypothetical protein
MSHYLQTGVKVPNLEHSRKKKKIMITLYGPYGDFKEDLIEIAAMLQSNGYDNCKLVSHRRYRSKEADPEIKIQEKSFHFLEKSNIIGFIFFCDRRGKDKIAHEGSPATELTHLIYNLSHKKRCCFVLRENGCDMSPVLFGLLKGSPIMYHLIEFQDNLEIAEIIKGRCKRFLQSKYNEII